MVQKALIASRSFQPGAKTTGICVSAFCNTLIREITPAGQRDTKSLNFRKIIED
jgi:hypothetical protein